ncbi:histidine--tRNA ligase [Patescibacteria group bacterium]|nr:histidine--tRNA ligase [Patescibacteria group bacterium]
MVDKPVQTKHTKTVAASKAKKPKSDFPVQTPRGTQDILPQDQKYWEYVVEMAKTVLRGFGWQRLDTPIFEEMVLFTRGLGNETDVVSKEMFDLKSRSRVKYSLRPEGTAPVVRAYIEHGMKSWPKPVKLFYVGPFFRYERPQAGRWRQHHQFGMEVFGSAAPITDAQIIYVAYVLLTKLGLEDYTIQLNSLGEALERANYIKLLKDHYRRNRSKMCVKCKERITTNPLRVLDCKEEKCQQLANTAPRLLDHLTDASRKHFDAVLATLDELSVPYDVAPSLVRGFDYYTKTVFEFVPKTQEEVAHNTLIGGGRYDKLVKKLGGKDTPALGWSGGVERIINQLKEEGVELTVTDAPRVFVAHLGEQAKHHALKLTRMLQEADIPFGESLDRDGMEVQLKAADRLKVKWTLIMGHKELLDGTVILRSMDSGMQDIVAQEDLVKELQERLGMTAAD